MPRSTPYISYVKGQNFSYIYFIDMLIRVFIIILSVCLLGIYAHHPQDGLLIRERRSPQFDWLFGGGGGHKGHSHASSHHSTHTSTYGVGPFYASYTSSHGHSNSHASGYHNVGKPYGGYGYKPGGYGYGHGNHHPSHGYRPHHGGGYDLFSFLDF